MKCVRCLNDSAEVVAKAPDGSGAWEVFYCKKCNYSWRSTEEEDVINPDKLDPHFKLDKIDFDEIKIGIPIQARLKK
ncbi:MULTISPECIES: non-oxidative hydroxyarylic acid decarboxylases subunit D [Clostridium]|uniref:non-oxidative hydroxyarylic acid decarboxylases subunit D n=1 Tax=Clostridium TaxID=1485 RepID=UPI0009839879|nr:MULTISPECIES: non-oxidative hydroxyarylic acid decarboxylases subunit D [Clostridium]AQR96858.1 phenolic acid decarboxylase subunit D [Clostridium saccharoperbutylacetonicum]NSB32736.1 late competence protein required for DNA uptake (superfamily II DNA/RNA helicase) [Clostridium saccharoperbutylacetonicum]